MSTPSSALVMEARGLVKHYGHVTALDGADFELLPGETLASFGLVIRAGGRPGPCPAPSAKRRPAPAKPGGTARHAWTPAPASDCPSCRS